MAPRSPFKALLLAAGLTFLPAAAQVTPLPLEATPGLAGPPVATELTVAQGREFHFTNLTDRRLGGTPPKRVRPVLNFNNPNRIVVRHGVPDPVVDRRAPEGADAVLRGTAGLTNPLKNFEGLNFMQHGSGWPPDTNGDVGINHYVQAVNSSIGVFSKSTGALLASASFDDFFPEELGVPCDAENNGDPIILFDQINKRWFLLDFAWSGTTNGSYFSIAASQTADPLGAWWAYCLKSDNTFMNDYPKCGVWHDGIYISANMFEFSGDYHGAKLWAVKTPDLYTGTLKVQQTGLITSLAAFTLMPSCARGTLPPPAGTPNYFFSLDADEYGGSHTDALHIWQWTVNWSSPAASLLTGPTILPVAPFDLSYDVPGQPGTWWPLDTLADRLMYANIYRHNAWSQLPNGTLSRKPYGAFYLSHTVDYAFCRAVRWYEVRVQDNAYSVHQQGTFSPDSDNRWMGSVCADKWGNVAIGYSISSGVMYPSIRYAGHRANDPLGVMGQGEKVLVNGTGSQIYLSRWGDYSMMTIDPVDDETFWYTQQYYAKTATGSELPNWHTRIGAFKFTRITTPLGTDVPDPALAVALDLPSQPFVNKGTLPFGVSTDSPYYGPSCVAAPVALGDGQACRLETTVTGPATIRFAWRVSSEYYYDWLTFHIDGTVQDGISGEWDWTVQTYTLGPGTHTLAWTYSKDFMWEEGQDTGWVDRFQILPAGPTLVKGVTRK